MKTVVFTGAGAAKADGLPLQTELFHEFFARVAVQTSRTQLANDVASFFETVFGRDPRVAQTSDLPTFEEALGVLELAVNREETVLGVASEQTVTGGGLRLARRQLILALAATVARESMSSTTYHSKLVAALRDRGLLQHVAFITTNYDTLLDHAIEFEGVASGRGTGSLVDYGLRDVLTADAGAHAETRTFPCYKIHGSLNWLYCSACDVLDITYASDGVLRLVDSPQAAKCTVCETVRTPVIVPPSYYKSMSNLYLALVWNRAFQALRQAEHLVFCGYSFPDADMHVKYLVKRAQLNREPAAQPLGVTVVNHYPGKPQEHADAERHRFERFLGGVDVNYSRYSFQDFAANPETVLTP